MMPKEARVSAILLVECRILLIFIGRIWMLTFLLNPS